MISLIWFPILNLRSEAMNIFKKIALTIWILFCTASFALASDTVLLGNGTLNTSNDLTRFQVNNKILEFLDLTATAGVTVDIAVATYAPAGFHWANGSEMSDMLKAFGITYSINPGGLSGQLGGSNAQRASYISYFGTPGITGDTANVGWVDDHTTSSLHTYLCVGVVGCGTTNGAGGSFVNSTANTTIWPKFFFYGTYLVRSVPVAAVPEPSTYLTMLAGLAILFCYRNRQQRPWNEKRP